MRKTNVVKILKMTILLIVFSLICSHKVQASEASVSANNCNVGENFTVTVNIPQDVSGYDIGGITVTYSDGSTQSAKRAVKVNMDLTWPGNYTYSFPGKVAGNATISVNGIILSNSSYAVINTITNLETSITIIDPTPPPVETPPAESTENTETPSPENPVTPDTNTPSPSVEVNFRDTNEKMYTLRRVNVRQSYGTDSGIIQTLSAGTEVIRTGIGDKQKDGYSWSRISYNGITGYMISGALTDEAPVKEEPPVENNTVENPDEIPPEEEIPEEKDTIQDDNAKIAAMAQEFGVIPEVGLNIMPFFFLGSCVSCVVLMLYVKKF